MEARIAEIKQMKWREIKALAESFDPPLQKGEDDQWEDLAEAIALAESQISETEESVEEESGSNPEVEIASPEPKEEPKSSESEKDYSYQPGRYARVCSACGYQIQTGLNGELICPVQDPECPRTTN